MSNNRKSRSVHTLDEIEHWISKGYNQKAANCRVLLDKIQALGQENAELRREITELRQQIKTLELEKFHTL